MILEFHNEKYASLKEMYLKLIKEYTLVGDNEGDLKPTLDQIREEMRRGNNK